ncbi:MAG: peroxiredoxin [Methanobacteriota archaeon]|nr:MAG: peroxiredoxin [Euryarchaeota archaeon]
MVDLAVDDVVDPEGCLHLLSVVEMPGAGPSEDDLVLPVRPLHALDELKEHRLRVGREDPAHREGHAHGTEAERIHRMQSDDLGLVVDVAVDVPRVGDDDIVAPERSDEGGFHLAETVRHPDGPALCVELRLVGQDAEHEAGLPVVRRNAAEERGQRDVAVVRHQCIVRSEYVLRHSSPYPGSPDRCVWSGSAIPLDRRGPEWVPSVRYTFRSAANAASRSVETKGLSPACLSTARVPRMVEVGQKAPDFTVLSDEGKPVTLSKELGAGPVILSFYVWDFTNVCQGQLCAMRDSMGDLQKWGAKVFGISTDSHHSHRVFKEQNRLNYPLLSDWNKTVSTTYGVLYERFGSFGLHGVTKRSVFVLDADGVIRYKWVTEDPKVPPDHERILEEVKKHVT